MSENKVGRRSRSEPRHVFYSNKPTYEVWTRLKSKVSQSSGEKSLSNKELALWLLQSYETRFTDSCTRCAKINSENINDHADGIKENSKDGDVHSRSVASFCSGSTARPQSTDVAQGPLIGTLTSSLRLLGNQEISFYSINLNYPTNLPISLKTIFHP